MKVEVRPNLILAAEKELGIVAGLQDRVAQVYGGLVYMVPTFLFHSIFCALSIKVLKKTVCEQDFEILATI